MGMTTFVRLECDSCSAHRDLTAGDTENESIFSGLSMIIRWRAKAIGWTIDATNANKKTLCERCSRNELLAVQQKVEKEIELQQNRRDRGTGILFDPSRGVVKC